MFNVTVCTAFFLTDANAAMKGTINLFLKLNLNFPFWSYCRLGSLVFVLGQENYSGSWCFHILAKVLFARFYSNLFLNVSTKFLGRDKSQAMQFQGCAVSLIILQNERVWSNWKSWVFWWKYIFSLNY